MSRFDDGIAQLRAGKALLLLDEQSEVSVQFVTSTGTQDRHALRAMLRDGRGPVTVVSRPGAAAVGTVPRDLEAAGVARTASATGGTLARPGMNEGASDLMNAAGLDEPALVRTAALPGGVLASNRAVDALAQRWLLPVVSVQDVVARRLANETTLEEIAAADFPSAYAEAPLVVHAFRSLLDGVEHLALVRRRDGAAGFGPEPLVRLHSECLTGDALGSLRCDCGDQLRSALRAVGSDPQGGAVLYLRGQEGRGIGLANKIRAYALQDQGYDTVEANTRLGFAADARDYAPAVQMLRTLGLTRLRLLSNNPRKRLALERYGIAVAETCPLRIEPNPHNAAYLETKRLRMGHDLAAAPQVDPAL